MLTWVLNQGEEQFKRAFGDGEYHPRGIKKRPVRSWREYKKDELKGRRRSTKGTFRCARPART